MLFEEESDQSILNTITISSSSSTENYGAAQTTERQLPSSKQVFANTLDEPVFETILRDLKMIAYKMKYVLLPKMNEERGKQLQNWDLWGPLLLCLCLALILSISSSNQSDIVFGTIFVVIWLGAGVLTINAKLLQGKISFFQSICVLGYCVCPIVLISFILAILPFPPSFCFFLLLGACFWSCYSSIGFMTALIVQEKQILAVYPIILFYLFLGWFSFISLS